MYPSTVLYKIFYAGNKNTGALPHHHQTAFNILVSGRKRWVLFETDTPMGAKLQDKYSLDYPYGYFLNSKHWFENEYNTTLAIHKKRGGEVYEFIQEAGDVVLIPNQWSHTVLNLEESLGITLVFDVK